MRFKIRTSCFFVFILVENDLLDTSIEMPSFNPCRTNCKCSTCFIVSCISFIMGIFMLFALDPLVNEILANVRGYFFS